MSASRRRNFSLCLAGVGGFAALVHLALSYPACLHVADSVPGEMSDGVSALGHVWLVYYNVLQRHGGFAFTRMAFYPSGIVFCVRPLLAWYALLGYVGGFFTNNLVLWYNLGLIASSVVTAMGVWMLGFRLTRSGAAALLAVVLYTFSTRRMDNLQAHINYYSTGFLVWSVVAMQTGLRRHSGARPWVMAGIIWAMQVWQSPDMAFYIGFCWAPLALWYWWRAWADRARGVGTGRLVWAPLLSPCFPALSFLPILIAAVPYLHLRLSYDEVIWPRTHWFEFLYPSPRHFLYRPWGRFIERLFFDPGHHEAFIGFGGLVATAVFFAVCAFRLKRMRPWILLSVLALLLTLGKSLSIPRVLDVPLPYGLMLHLPVLKELRVPARFTTILTLGVSLMGAMGWTVCRRRRLRATGLLWALLFGLALLDGWLVPLPFTKLRNDPRYYPMRLLEKIRRDPRRDICVLGVPVQIPSTRSQAQQMIHEHPTYDGFDPRLREEQIEQLRLGPIRFLLAGVGGVSIAQSEKSLAAEGSAMSVAEFRRRIEPAHLKYILLTDYENRQAASQRRLIRHYFDVAGEETDGFWTLFTLRIPLARGFVSDHD